MVYRKNIKSILIVKFGALGDVVRTSYILKGLYQKYRHLKVFWLTSESAFDLLRFNPYIDILSTPSFNFGLVEKTDFDLIISLDDEVDILTQIAGIKHSKIIGAQYDNKGSITYDDQSSPWFDMGLISKYGKAQADILKKKNKLTHGQIMGKIFGIKIIEPLFFNSRVIEKRMAKVLDKSFFNIGLNSSAGKRWLSKQMPLHETIELTKMLLPKRIKNKRVRLLLLGGGEEFQRNYEINRAVRSKNVFDIGAANSLLELAALIKNCNYLISSDSLALHLAISQKIPNLSFYAPTSAAEIDTFGTGVKVLSLSDDYCSYKSDCDNTTLTASRIVEAFKSHLKSL